MRQARAETTGARREFLRQGFAVTGGALAAALGGDAVSGVLPAVPRGSAPQPQTGYRETAHVRRYYETTRD